MQKIIALTLASEMGIKALLAMKEDEIFRNADIAQSLNCSAAHMSKILQRLAKRGIVKPVRGPKGGYALAKPLKSVTILDVIEAIDSSLVTQSVGNEVNPVGRFFGRMHNRAMQDLDVRLTEI